MARRSGYLLVLLCLVFCLPACSGDTVTDGGVPCTRNEECAVGEYCQNGFCKPYTTCTSDDDCAEGEICHLGVCEPGTRPDAGDGGDGEPADGQPDGGDPAADQPPPQPEITLAGDVIVHEDAQGKTYEINYGSVTIGTPVSRVMIIRNTGDADLEISVITIDEDPQSEFTLEPAVPPALVIKPGEEEALGVTYSAVDGLTDVAVLKIFSNDSEEGEIHVNLVSEFKGEAQIYLDPLALDFGDVPLNQAPTLAVEIHNQGTGNAVLRVDSATPEAPIATAYDVILVDPATDTELTPPIHLNRGDFIRADVTFTTPSRDTYEGDLIVLCNDPNTPEALVRLRGRAGMPAMVVTPESINFGQVPSNTQAPDQTVTIRNDGVGDLNVSSIELAVGSSADISLDSLPNLPAMIPPAGEVSITVRYFPVDVGTDMATMVIQHDDPDRQPDVRVDIGGEGIQGNANPTAVIWANGQNTTSVSVLLNEQVNLDGSHSFDTEGTVTAYEWRIVQQPAIHPCGQESVLTGTMNDITSIRLREAGVTTIGLKVKDDLDAWSDEDLLEIHVEAKPQADIRVGGNTTGYIEVDMGDSTTFDGTFSTDCDGIVTGYQWSWALFPPGRGTAPTIGGGVDFASVLFNFPGMYAIQLVVEDNDNNLSDPVTFDVLVKGPKAFRVTADWYNRGSSDHHVDIDLHMLKPGSTDFFSPDDCCPDKGGSDDCYPTPNWGVYGSPVYQRDSWEDADAAEPPNPASPADEINFNSPGMGLFDIYVHFRCHSSTNIGGYLCCDDFFKCPIIITCQDQCDRRAEGMVIIYVTDYDNQETEIARRGFSIDEEQTFATFQIGTLSWPDGNFQ